MMIFFLITQNVSVKASSLSAIESLQNNIYKAYITGDMSLWERTLSEMETMYARRPTNALLYDILLAQYGIIGYYLGVDQKDRASFHLDRAWQNLDRLSKSQHYRTASLVFESSFLAFRIALRPLRAVQLGPRSYRVLDQALEADPSYARVWIEKGNAAFYTPPMFGGNRLEALDHYRKAISMFERNLPNNHRWLYLSTLMALANAYKSNDEPDKAIRTIEKALAFEPAFAWALEELHLLKP